MYDIENNFFQNFDFISVPLSNRILLDKRKFLV